MRSKTLGASAWLLSTLLLACPADDEPASGNGTCEGTCSARGASTPEGYKCGVSPKGECSQSSTSRGPAIVCCVPIPCGDGAGTCILSSQCQKAVQGRAADCFDGPDTSYTCCAD